MKKIPKHKLNLPEKKLILPQDAPVYIPLPFEDALKVALNTPIKKSKINKKY